ncbi:MAG: AAA family ATPase [Thermodesulfobacteriota bacterium]|nr:AAA family ATPase [Thermodesulfobacteriota bacterium]
MPKHVELKTDELRWRLDPSTLPFDTTDDIEPLEEIIGQDRGMEAFRFGMDIDKPGYNVLVTGQPRSGRLDVIKKLLSQVAQKKQPPCEFCYVNNFKNPESPLLLRFEAGIGSRFKEDAHVFIETLKTEIPLLFEGQDYIARKKELMETYEKRRHDFFETLSQRVKEQGFALVSIQGDQTQRPQLVPLVDDEPMPIHNIGEMVKKGRFPEAEYKDIKKKFKQLKKDIDKMFFEVNDLQKEVRDKGLEMDKHMFIATASEFMAPLLENYTDEASQKYLAAMLEDLAGNLPIFFTKSKDPSQKQMMPMMQPPGDPFMAYQVNLLVDNSEQKKQPVIIESYPTYRNLFGSIERVVDNRGVWRTDFTKIKVGSFLKANGGYLVLNLSDILTEPGVWPALKRALKTKMMEIQTFDPAYWFTSSGIKPEAIEIDIKVILLADPYLYQLLLHYDEDVPKIFKVRADFDQSMNRTDDSIKQFAEFIRATTKDEELRAFDKSGVGALVEQSVRMTGRREKLSTSFPRITDLIREADYWAGRQDATVVGEEHVDKAIQARIYRSNLVEEKIQEMIDRGSMMIDTEGSIVGQVNGLSVYTLGDYMFGRPSRITATTSMGKAGVINIEREAKLAGPIHNKGVLILSGYLRQKFAQNKPLSISASLAFEQSYGGVEGDSASSTEIYALLSSLSGIPIKQNIAITGSVNQKGDIQPIGGVNAKIEGFYDCCKSVGLTGEQGVLIPATNVADLMIRKDVVEAVKEGKFHVYAIKTIDEGIGILTGMAAGKYLEDGSYPENTINYLVDNKLKELAEGLHQFGKEEEDS